MMRPLLGLLFTILSLPLAAETLRSHRIAIEPLEVHGVVSESERGKVLSEIRAAISRDGRAVVMSRDEEMDALLLSERALVQKAYGAFDVKTAPERGKLVAANYKLKVSLFADERNPVVTMQLIHLETGYTVGNSTMQWRSGQQPNVAVAVGEILNFIPRPSPLPSGWITMDAEPVQASVKFLNETETRPLPLRRLERRPGRYALVVLPPNEDYEAVFQEVRVEPAKEQVVRVTLQRRRVSVTLPEIRPGSALYFDGQFVGPGVRQLMAEAGRHDVAVLDSEGTLQTGSFDAGVGKPNRASLDLMPEVLRREAERRKVYDTALSASASAITSIDDDLVVLGPQRLSVVEVLTGNERWSSEDGGYIGAPVVLGGRVIAARHWLETTTSGGGRGPSTTTTTLYAGVSQTDRLSGKLIESAERHNTAQILDSTSEAVLYFGDDALFLIRPGEKRAPVPLDPRGRSAPLDIRTARLGGQGVVVASRDRRTLHSYYLSGQRAWSVPVDDAVNRLFTRGEDLLVITEGKRLLRLSASKGTVLWEQPLQPVPRFVRFAGSELLLVGTHGEIARIDVDGGQTVRSKLTVGDLDVITDCGALQSGRLLVTVAGHRLAIANISTATIEWQSDFDERIVGASSDHGFAAAVTADGRLHVVAVSARARAVGWIAAVDAARGTIDVATALPALGSERFRVYAFADFLTRSDAASVDLPVDGARPRRAGVVTVSVPDVQRLHVGQVIVRAGALKIETPYADSLVWVDGWFECRGDCLIAGLAEGRHDVVVARRGFVPHRASITIGSEIAVLRPVIEGATEEAVLVVDSAPRGADVFIGDKYAGNTSAEAVKWNQVSLNQWTKVRVEKQGYETQQELLEQAEPYVARQYELKQAAPFGEFFLGYSAGRAAPALGWSADSITTDGVTGPPLRKAEAKAAAFVRAGLQLTVRHLAGSVFGEGRAGNNKGVVWGGGLHWIAGSVPVLGEIAVGAQFAHMDDAESSTPPEIQSGQESKSDPSAPLERWSHPIPNVLVDNEPSEFIGAVFMVRPQTETFIRLTAGKLLGKRYRGTLLVPDSATGHLVKDGSHSYDVQLQSSTRARIEVQTPLASLLPWQTKRRYVIYGMYEQQRADFGVFSDQWKQFGIGLGLAFYQSWGR